MSSPAEGIKDLLVAASLGTFGATDGWSIRIGDLFDSPDTLVVIKESGGQPPNPAWLIDFPSVQIIIRGNEKGYQAARTQARKVKDELLGLPSQDLNGDRWVAINMISDIADIGRDEKKRPMWSINFGLIIEPAATAETNRLAL